MRIALVHNRYRSNMPSGENRVVDTEAGALADAGHQVIRFEKHNDEIDHWSCGQESVVASPCLVEPGGLSRPLRPLREHRPDVVHVHNTFPLLSPAVLYACRAAAVPVVVTLHNYRLACANGSFFRDGTVCHDCAHGLPGAAVRHGCYLGSRAATGPAALALIVHRPAWKSLVSAYVFISAAQRDLLAGLRFDPGRVFVRHNLIPYRSAPRVPRGSRPSSTPGGWPRPRACACSWPPGTATCAGPGTPGCGWS